MFLTISKVCLKFFIRRSNYGISLIIYCDIFALEIQPSLMTNVRSGYISRRQIICLSWQFEKTLELTAFVLGWFKEKEQIIEAQFIALLEFFGSCLSAFVDPSQMVLL